MANAGRFKERTAQGVPAAGVANRLVKGELEASVRHREVSTPDSIRRARNQPGPGERRAAPGDVGVDPNLRQGKFGGTRADAVQVDRLLVSQKGTLTERALERQRQGMTGGSLPDDQPAGCGSQKEALGASACFEHNPDVGPTHHPDSVRVARNDPEPGGQSRRLYGGHFDPEKAYGMPTPADTAGKQVAQTLRWGGGPDPVDAAKNVPPKGMEDQPFGRASQGANESAAALVHYDGVDLPGYEMEAKGSHPDARPCGMQSLRTDRVEPRHRSVSDRQGYAGETGAGGLLSPTPLTQRGFRHGEFEQPRSKGEIRALFQRIGKPLSDEVFDKAWGDAVASTGAADAVSVEAFRAALNAL